MTLFSLQNFVDYENVEPGVGPVRQVLQAIEDRNFTKSDYKAIKYSFDEHDVTLEDDLVQIMTQPEPFTMLNLDRNSRLEIPASSQSDQVFFMYMFDLSNKILVEKRQVKSLP